MLEGCGESSGQRSRPEHQQHRRDGPLCSKESSQHRDCWTQHDEGNLVVGQDLVELVSDEMQILFQAGRMSIGDIASVKRAADEDG